MKKDIKKIKAIRTEYHERIGPAEVITLGFKVGDISYILGTVYIGPYMQEGHAEWLKKTEEFIDYIVDVVDKV